MLEIRKSVFRENIEAFAIAVVTILFIIIFVVQSFLVKGSSMEPTLHDGERLLVNKFIFHIRQPVTGDIIVLKPPKEMSKKYIKRVIAGPDQHLFIDNGKVYVNEVELAEPYIKEKITPDYHTDIWVPNDALFVMGDNRNGSKDSRDPEVGLIPLNNVVGKAIFVFWPPKNTGVLFRPKYPDNRQPVDYNEYY